METGGPIEGAIVVARWELEGYGGNFAGWLFVAEAVTDHDGVFHFPSWGPLKSPAESGMQTRMSPNVPDISIFKPYYLVSDEGCCSNTGYLDEKWNFGSGPTRRVSWADRRAFALSSFRGTLAKYADYLEASIPTNGPDCAFMSTPHVFAAAVLEERQLRTRYHLAVPHQRLEYFEEMAIRERCGRTVASVIGEHIK
ncbi:MAG: hypothetical protein ABI440_03505 [Casimicrobiaceae bacterium]